MKNLSASLEVYAADVHELKSIEARISSINPQASRSTPPMSIARRIPSW